MKYKNKKEVAQMSQEHLQYWQEFANKIREGDRFSLAGLFSLDDDYIWSEVERHTEFSFFKFSSRFLKVYRIHGDKKAAAFYNSYATSEFREFVVKFLKDSFDDFIRFLLIGETIGELAFDEVCRDFLSQFNRRNSQDYEKVIFGHFLVWRIDIFDETDDNLPDFWLLARITMLEFARQKAKEWDEYKESILYAPEYAKIRKTVFFDIMRILFDVNQIDENFEYAARSYERSLIKEVVMLGECYAGEERRRRLYEEIDTLIYIIKQAKRHQSKDVRECISRIGQRALKKYKENFGVPSVTPISYYKAIKLNSVQEIEEEKSEFRKFMERILSIFSR